MNTDKLALHLGLKTDSVEYRYSYAWLFRLMAEEGVFHAQLGSFFEMYQLPDEFFVDLRRQAESFGVRISSVFTTHRELGGFFREDPAWHAVAMRSLRRMIEIGALVGADSVGGNPGSVLRDQPEQKAAGMRRYLDALKQLLAYAHQRGLPWVVAEPMSCWAEPPATPAELAAMGEELAAYHAAHPESTARAGFCADTAHGYVDEAGVTRVDNLALLRAALPYLQAVHLKNTDRWFEGTFGFGEEERERGIVRIEQVRDLLLTNAAVLPVREMVGYLELAGPKLGRDYSDPRLDEVLRESLRFLREAFC